MTSVLTLPLEVYYRSLVDRTRIRATWTHCFSTVTSREFLVLIRFDIALPRTEKNAGVVRRCEDVGRDKFVLGFSNANRVIEGRGKKDAVKDHEKWNAVIPHQGKNTEVSLLTLFLGCGDGTIRVESSPLPFREDQVFRSDTAQVVGIRRTPINKRFSFSTTVFNARDEHHCIFFDWHCPVTMSKHGGVSKYLTFEGPLKKRKIAKEAEEPAPRMLRQKPLETEEILEPRGLDFSTESLIQYFLNPARQISDDPVLCVVHSYKRFNHGARDFAFECTFSKDKEMRAGQFGTTWVTWEELVANPKYQRHLEKDAAIHIEKLSAEPIHIVYPELGPAEHEAIRKRKQDNENVQVPEALRLTHTPEDVRARTILAEMNATKEFLAHPSWVDSHLSTATNGPDFAPELTDHFPSVFSGNPIHVFTEEDIIRSRIEQRAHEEREKKRNTEIALALRKTAPLRQDFEIKLAPGIRKQMEEEERPAPRRRTEK